MLYIGSNLRRTQVGLQSLYLKGFNAAKPIYVDWCAEVPSTTTIEEYVFSGGLPRLRKWDGERQKQNIREWVVQIRNETYEGTLAIPREVIEDDKLGNYSGQAEQLGMAARLHGDVLFIDALNGGFTDKCFDGRAFFATNHPIRGGTQSNKVTGALDATTFYEGLGLLEKMVDYDGTPLDIASMGGELRLLVPPDSRSAAETILDKQFLSAGESNPNYKRARLMVNARLTAGTWFLGYAGGSVRPFVRQTRRAPEVVTKAAVGDGEVFWENEVVYGVSYRGALGLGDYRAMVGRTP